MADTEAQGGDVLSPEEMDVLSQESTSDDSISLYDFHQPAHRLKVRMPGLEAINERFVKAWPEQLEELWHKEIQLTPPELQLVTFKDYINSLSLNALAMPLVNSALKGRSLAVFDADLVYLMVDSFFGGQGSLKQVKTAREYTSSEWRLAEKTLIQAFDLLHNAWQPVADCRFDIEPDYRDIVLDDCIDDNEVMVISKFGFTVDSETSLAEFHLSIPFSHLEPFKTTLLTTGHRDQSENNQSFQIDLAKRMQETELQLRCVFARAKVSVGELIQFKTGDFIPFVMQDVVPAYIGDVHVLNGRVGVQDNKAAIKFQGWHQPAN